MKLSLSSFHVCAVLLCEPLQNLIKWGEKEKLAENY